MNPTSNVKLNVMRSKNDTQAYTLSEVSAMLTVLEDAAKVITAVGAFTGLRRGEIVALKWEDYNGDEIQVRRNICFGERGEMVVENPKTEASAAPVPVIRPLRLILDKWKAKQPVTDGCWMFQADYTRKRKHSAELLDAAQLTPVHPQNILRDVMMPRFHAANIEWKGYHGFRRGLATNLRALGVDDLTISEVLRHSDVKVTRDCYIKRVSEKSTEAMTRLERQVSDFGADMPIQ